MGKLDSLGNIEWIKNFCDTPVFATTVCQIPDGGYAINGGSYFASTMSIFRYDALGNYLWRRDYGKGANSGTSQIISTPDNGFLLFGAATDRDSDITVTYDYPPRTFATIDWVLIKLDSLGNKQWVRTLGTSGDESYAQVISIGKNYYLVGSTDSKDHDCADVANHPGFSIYTIKLDSAGNVLWSKAYGAGFVSKLLYDERDGSILVTGRSQNGRPEFPNGHGYDDIFLMKVDTSGNFKWGNLYGTSLPDEGHDICKAPNGGYFAAGRYTNIFSNTLTSGVLLSLDGNGNQLDMHLVGGYLREEVVFDRIFSFGNSYCVFGMSGALRYSEGTGQNCAIDSTKGSGCFSLSTLKMLPSGILEQPQYTSLFSLSPNPARSIFELQFAGGHIAGRVICTNSSGAVIYQQSVLASQDRLPVSTAQWASGTYVVCWQPVGGAQQCQKLVVQ